MSQVPPSTRPSLSRRRLLQAGGIGALVAAGGVGTARLLDGADGATGSAGPIRIGPTSPAVATTEAARSTTGRVVRRPLRAVPTTLDLGGATAKTWAYEDLSFAEGIRASVGDELRVRLTNDLPESTSIHWHGLALRNDMDGVPGLTQEPIAPGSTFEYRFVLAHPGTYFFHPHSGLQQDRGLLAPLIIEDPDEPGAYDDEVVLTLDDWTDGLGETPDDILAGLRDSGMDMGGMDGMDMDGMDMDGMDGMDPGIDPANPLGEDTGDVDYVAHLINGRLPDAPITVTSAPGRRIRLRIVNAGGDTPYRFAVGGHRLTITHADGFPVRPVEVDTLIIGMGERYDVVLEAGDGAFPVVAVPEGKDERAGFAVLRTAPGAAPSPRSRPAELRGRMLSYADLSPTDEVELPVRRPDRRLPLRLTMGDGGREWLINGRTFADHEPLDIRAGERVRLVLENQSMMFHPMHLHGHTFAVADRAGRGLRKDTINVLPMQTISVDFEADNPGQWLVHCHNAYHAELGMMTVVSYIE